jgi:hypothetical protein
MSNISKNRPRAGHNSDWVEGWARPAGFPKIHMLKPGQSRPSVTLCGMLCNPDASPEYQDEEDWLFGRPAYRTDTYKPYQIRFTERLARASCRTCRRLAAVH